MRLLNTNVSALGDLKSIAPTQISQVLSPTAKRDLRKEETVSKSNGLDKRSVDQLKFAPTELKQPETTRDNMKRASLSQAQTSLQMIHDVGVTLVSSSGSKKTLRQLLNCWRSRHS